jgi:hypothetical protein
LPTPAWLAAVAGQTARAGQINQFLGTHSLALLYQGTSQVSNTASGTGVLGTNDSTRAQWIAQPFTTAGGQTTITRVEIWLSQQGTGADTTLELRTNNAGVPSNSILASTTIPADFQTNAWISIPLNVTGLTAATMYHLVIDGTASTVNWCNVSRSTPTVVNQILFAYASTGPWTGIAATMDFNVFAGVNGVLRNTLEDGGARWTGLDYSITALPPTTIREYTVGSSVATALRSVRTLNYSGGQLTSVT